MEGKDAPGTKIRSEKVQIKFGDQCQKSAKKSLSRRGNLGKVPQRVPRSLPPETVGLVN